MCLRVTMTSSTHDIKTDYLPRALIWIGHLFVYHTCKMVRFTYKYGITIHNKQGQRKAWRIPSPKNLTGDLDLWPRKSIWLQILLTTKYVPSLVKIHRRMLILECSQGCYAVKIWPLDLWPWKTIGFHSPKDYVCTKFGQNPLKDVDSRVFTRMLRGKNLTRWHWPLTLKINRVPDSPKD